MDSDLIIGLRISVIGFSLTFLALALMILVILFLLRFFPDKDASGQGIPGPRMPMISRAEDHGL